MAIAFSESTNNTGIVQQVRALMRVDSTQWPTSRIVNSCNNWLDTVTGYAIGADKRFQWDDTNHTKLPEGTTTLTSGQSDYSFLLDEQGNTIVTLLGVSLLNSTTSKYEPLEQVDRAEVDTAYFGTTSGTPTAYDKIADNIIRLNYSSSSTISSGIKFYFQRTPSYFAATDTTKTPGVSPLLHRGFVIASAYDGAITLGLDNAGVLAQERKIEEDKMIRYFSDRNQDRQRGMSMKPIQFR